jgi:hypothetical protein
MGLYRETGEFVTEAEEIKRSLIKWEHGNQVWELLKLNEPLFFFTRVQLSLWIEANT